MRAESREGVTTTEDDPRNGSLFFADLRTQLQSELNPVLGLVHLLMDTDLDESQIGLAKAVLARCDRMSSRLADLLTVSSLRAGRIKLARGEFSLSTAVRLTVGNHVFEADRRGLHLSTTVADELRLDVAGDHDRFCQILSNLTRVAIHTATEGTICVEASRIAANRNHVVVRVAVSLIGDCIEERTHASLAEFFEDDEDKPEHELMWSSTCCAISRELAKLMGGRIGLEMEGLDRTTLWFTVVLDSPRPEESCEAPERKKAADDEIEPVRVLVVTSDPELTGACLVALNRSGFAATHEANRDNMNEIVRRESFAIVAMEGELPTLVATLAILDDDSPGMRLIPVVGIPTVRGKLDDAKWLDVVRLWSSAD